MGRTVTSEWFIGPLSNGGCTKTLHEKAHSTLKTVISPALIHAYRHTCYGVQAETPFAFMVGHLSRALQQLMAHYGCQSAVYLTACNPHSRALAAEENARRQEQLAEALRQRGLAFVPGVGQGLNTDWVAEPSYWVPFLSLEDGKVLGQHFNQNAIIWCEPKAVPQLILLR